MSSEIRRLTPDQFAALLEAAAPTLTRTITAVHLHHTWRPTRAQFRGRATVEAMRDYHVRTNGWDDIAQHLTVDPHGHVWTGRNWNAPPASQRGKNGTATAGPFMIEIVGDFDEGRDVLEGEQREALVAVVASLMDTFGLAAAAIQLHRELGSPKTCPGTGFDKAAILREVQAARRPRAVTPRGAKGKRPAKPRKPVEPPFGPEHWFGSEVTRPADPPRAGFEDWAIGETEYAAEAIGADARERVRAIQLGQGEGLGAALQRADDRWEVLRPHVVNLTKGRLSQSGTFKMDERAIERIIAGIREYAETTAQPRLMLHAHGGLVGEKSALEYARDALGWWRDHRIYPVYFVWETHFLEVFKQKLGIARAGFGDLRDRTFEGTARPAGKPLWDHMKESALLSSSVDAGGGEAGGARKFAEALAALVASRPAGRTIEVHAVGHSAGAIFHSHLIPVLLDRGVTVQSLALLAPAVRTDLFKEKLLAPIKGGQVGAFTMYTMEEEAERADDCVKAGFVTLYGKSLLYLVSRAFEPKRKTAILGLEEMLAEDKDVEKLFTSGAARLELSRARGREHNPNTHARKHGCFDNDVATMGAVLRRIAGADPGKPFPVEDPDCVRASARALVDWSLPAAEALDGPRPAVAGASGGARRALCVGIDNYRDSPLAGCVRDAADWARALEGLRFDVTSVLDRDATRQRILDALRALIGSARAGDVLVFQFSGHGTQAVDLNGDEHDNYDEALVPIDYGSGALLLDDDLAEVYRTVPNGATLTLFMDCCHSGTNSRFRPIDLLGARGSERRRFLPLTPELEAAHRQFRASVRTARPTSPEESLPGIIHFAACLDNQYAYESDGQGHFTREAAAALAGAVSRGTTNEDFSVEIATKVGALGRPQTPRLMRLPAQYAGRPLLAGSSAALPVPAGPPPGDRAWDERCLEFFEAGAAHLRQRLGR